MAKAQRVPPTKYVPVWEAYVTLTLSEEEAQALYDVARVIGGRPETTRRKYFSDAPGAILEVLEPYIVWREVKDRTGTILFA